MSKQKNDKADQCCQRIGELMSPGFFKALCDPNRIAILANLAECCGPLKVSEVAKCCPVDMSVVSRHLSMLRDAGILEAHKQGKEVYYSVCYSKLVGMLRDMADAIEACCPSKEEKNGR